MTSLIVFWINLKLYVIRIKAIHHFHALSKAIPVVAMEIQTACFVSIGDKTIQPKVCKSQAKTKINLKQNVSIEELKQNVSKKQKLREEPVVATISTSNRFSVLTDKIETDATTALTSTILSGVA